MDAAPSESIDYVNKEVAEEAIECLRSIEPEELGPIQKFSF